VSTEVIAVANQKGGVGKTTTAINLSASLVERGRRVLLIDLDPQANATSGLGMEKKRGGSVYESLLSGESPREKIVPTAYRRFDLLPSEVDLAGAEVDLVPAEDCQVRFRNVLAPLLAENRYDWILVDCPPSLGVLTINALAAAQGVLIPLQCEYYALEGLSTMTRLIRDLRTLGVNPGLGIEGIVMTMYDKRTRLAQQVVREVVTHFGDKVYDALIPRNVRLSEAPSFGKPVLVYDRQSTGALAYRRLAREFLARRSDKAPADAPVPDSTAAEAATPTEINDPETPADLPRG
jgi:chromosome partitioning protein